MADKDLKISIKTTGADSAAREIRKVEDAGEKLARSQSKSASVQPSRDLTRANEAATRSFAQLTEKVRVSEIAHYDLSAGLRKTTSATETFTAGNTKLNAPLRNNSQALLLFSQGFEDAQYGIRGVLNNIPGLIVSLGGTAGLAGAISIAAVGLSLLYEKFGGVKEKAGEAAEKVRDAATAMGEMEGKRFDKVTEGIEAARDKVESLEVKFQETNKSQAAFAIATLDNAAKIKLAEENIATALGLQIDRKKQLTELAAAEGAKRNLVAQQAVDIENQRLVEAEKGKAQAQSVLTATQTQLEVEKGKLITLRQQLVEMREYEGYLKRQANFKADKKTQTLEQIDSGVKKSFEAKKELKSFDYSGQIAGMQERVKALDLAIRNMVLKVVPKAENSVNAATAAVTDIQTSVTTNIQRLEQTLAADTLVAKSEELVTSGEKFATDIEGAFGKVEATTAAGVAAKELLETAVADGKITANEQAAVAKSMQTLMGQLQSGQATFSGNVRDLVSLQQEFLKSQMQSALSIQRLKAQAAQQQQQINQIFSRIR